MPAHLLFEYKDQMLVITSTLPASNSLDKKNQAWKEGGRRPKHAFTIILMGKLRVSKK